MYGLWKKSSFYIWLMENTINIFGRLHGFDQIEKKTYNRGMHIVPV